MQTSPYFFSQCHISFQICNLLGLKLVGEMSDVSLSAIFLPTIPIFSTPWSTVFIFLRKCPPGVQEVTLYTLCEVYYHLLLRLIDTMCCTIVICHLVAIDLWYSSGNSGFLNLHNWYTWHNQNIIEHSEKRHYMNSVLSRKCHT